MRYLAAMLFLSAVALADARPVADEVADAQLLAKAIEIESELVAIYEEGSSPYLEQHRSGRDRLVAAYKDLRRRQPDIPDLPTPSIKASEEPSLRFLAARELDVVRELGGTAHLYQDSNLRALVTTLALEAATRFGALKAQSGEPAPKLPVSPAP